MAALKTIGLKRVVKTTRKRPRRHSKKHGPRQQTRRKRSGT